MPNYTWSVKEPSGKIVIKEVTAASADESKYILLATGYTELELKEDDVMAAVNAGFTTERPRLFGQEIKVTAEARLKHRNDPTVTFGDVLRKGLAQSRGFVIFCILLASYEAYCKNYFSTLLVIAGLFFWLAFIFCLGLPLVYYQKLIKAVDWYQWDEVISLIETLRTIGRFSLVKVPATELIRNRCKALAATGRLNEALLEFRACDGKPDCPSWLYKLFIGTLYGIVKEYDKAIEYNLISIAENPTSVNWLDLANRYARYKRDPVKARAALLEAEKYPGVNEIIGTFRSRCQGIIAYLEGDDATARRELELTIEALEKAKNRPFRDGHLSVSRAYLCCVIARQGDLPAAKKNFALAKAYLIATEENELLAECHHFIDE